MRRYLLWIPHEKKSNKNGEKVFTTLTFSQCYQLEISEETSSCSEIVSWFIFSHYAREIIGMEADKNMANIFGHSACSYQVSTQRSSKNIQLLPCISHHHSLRSSSRITFGNLISSREHYHHKTNLWLLQCDLVKCNDIILTGKCKRQYYVGIKSIYSIT